MVLTAGGGSLRLTTNEESWCQVSLVTTGETRPLGAELLSYVASHLVSFLSERRTGRQWVFTLAELHVAAYGEHLPEGVLFHFMDAEAKFFATLALSSAQQAKWLEALSPHGPVPPRR
jgi:hypothetical protein